MNKKELIMKKELPNKIYYGLSMLNNGKPNCQLHKPYKLNKIWYIGYENIKSGGRNATLSVKGKTLEEAENKLYDILIRERINL